ncbi:MAG: hypothetical protein ABIJ12_06045 [bacterium]
MENQIIAFKNVTISIIGATLFALLVLSNPLLAQQDTNDSLNFPTLTGAYFGQQPPGYTPELFAPVVLVKPKQAHSNIVFSKDGTNAYWCYNGIWFSKIDNGRWGKPIKVPFSKEEFSDDAPFLSPDGKRLFFSSKRPMSESDKSRKENIWVVEIEDDSWSDARLLPPVVNNMYQHWQVSVDSEGTLYFGHKLSDNSDKDIYYSRFEQGEYQTPEKLDDMINSEYNEINPYISPQGDYLIFTRLADKQDISLFISFRLKNDSWSQSVNLKKYLQFRHIANCPIVSQDGKYLFFLDAYEGEYQRFWINAEFLDSVKATHPEIANFK